MLSGKPEKHRRYDLTHNLKKCPFGRNAAAADSQNRQTPVNIFRKWAEVFHSTQIAIKGFIASQNRDACQADIWNMIWP